MKLKRLDKSPLWMRILSLLVKHKKRANETSPLQTLLDKYYVAWLEDRKYDEAMRNLKELEWSTDYMIYLMKKCGQEGMKLTLVNNGVVTAIIENKNNKTVAERPRLVDPHSEEMFKQYMFGKAKE